MKISYVSFSHIAKSITVVLFISLLGSYKIVRPLIIKMNLI